MIRHSSSHVLPEDFSYIEGLAQRNFVGHGVLCQAFAAALALRFERAGCLLTGSGTAALEIALHELRRRRPRAEEVVVSAYVCPAVVSAVMREGLRPVFVDVQEGSLNIDADAVARVIGKTTLAVIMTHVGGIADPVTDIVAFNVPVISDCAQALGATWNGKALIAYGEVGIASFGPTKVLAAGGGGALFADEEGLFACAERHATEEWSVRDYELAGFVPTFGQHFSDLAAGLGQAQLLRFDWTLARRREIASRYTTLLRGRVGIELPLIANECEANNFRYYFFSSSAPEWLKLLREGGVDARTSISHNMTNYFPHGGLTPHLTSNARRLISLPIHAALSDQEVAQVVAMLEQGFALGLQ